jgi:CRISPR system Cascade subunit CasD
MKTLVIRIAAPLQSYGDPASFEKRTTFRAPSKSAVIGMIGAALGFRRESDDYKNLNDLDFAVRVDQPGEVLSDFQITHYSLKKPGKLSHRIYLQDAVFMVALSSEQDALMEEIEYALRHPKFQLYFGRRSNPPAGILKMKMCPDKTAINVLKELPWQASVWFQRKYKKDVFNARIYADAKLVPDRPNRLIKDAVGSFNQKSRYYEYRSVAEDNVFLENSNYFQRKNTDHDIWASI